MTKQLNNQTTSLQSSVFSFRCLQSRLGFTLIEIVVATGILSTVGLIAATIFFSSLKGGTKTEILKEVKQNGDFAISLMSMMIRNAREVSVCDETSNPQIEIVNPDWQTTRFLCDYTSGKIASNSAYLTSENLAVSDCSFTCWPQSKGQKKIQIAFTLAQRGSPLRVEEKAQATFETTVYTRSFSY